MSSVGLQNNTLSAGKMKAETIGELAEIKRGLTG